MGGANATLIDRDATTSRTELSPGESYELKDGVTWTIKGSTPHYKGLLNNNTITGQKSQLILETTQEGTRLNAALGNDGAAINVDKLTINADSYAIYLTAEDNKNIDISARDISISAVAESAIYNQGPNTVSISGFDNLVITGESESAIKSMGVISITGNQNSIVNLISSGTSAINSRGQDSVIKITAGTLNIDSTVDNGDLEEYKKSTLYSKYGLIDISANTLTVNANGSAVENAIASAANGSIQITSGNATVNGNINTLGEFNLNGTLNFNGNKAEISDLTGNSTINLFNKNQQLNVTNNGTLTIAGSGDLNDGYAGGLQNFYDTQLQGTNGENTTVLLKEGFYNGETSGVVSEDGKITNVKSSGASSVMHDTLDIASGSTVMLNRILMNDVHKRMGDLRNSAGMNGAWVRYDGGRLSGDHVANKFNTIQLGSDMPFADNFHAGVSASYTRGDVDFTRGGSGMDAYSFAAYGTWFAPNGMYADVIARYGYVKNELTVDNNLKGDLDNNAVALSGEFGWKFDVADNFFVTPQVEATYMHIDSDKVKLGGNTASYKFDSVDSFVGRAGLAAGYTFPNQKGNVFVKASAVHEFAGDSKVTAGNGTSLKKDGEDTWAEFGVGAQYNFNKNVQAWANLERTAGADIEEDYRATVGARINF